MTAPVDSKAVVDILEIVESIPAAGGYIIAMFGFSVFAWILALWARASQRSFSESQRSMQSVVAMSESLRIAMRLDMEKCEEECRRKDEMIDQLRRDRNELISQHSNAREEFLREARERELMHREAMREEARLRAELEAMTAAVHRLTEKLEAERNAKRRSDHG